MDIHAFWAYVVCSKTKGELYMAEMKNICGKIPIELHEQVRAEIEQTESSTQLFLQKIIEEHFMKKGAVSMAEARTIAVQVSEELFGRFKAVVAKKHCKQKEFLIEIITQAIAAEEAKWEASEQAARLQEPTGELPEAEHDTEE
ncbi:hypothetical protein SAMN02745243_00227 [Hespellia stercorisuis DSM 15480]|uniref:Uncharacterized protein n=2 Tax=Hespellia stercorisuis TaxID=180311 RepID=A0A1M6I4Q6_9FIRM|nr:hypothetical protein SAMN02745243_00227 [Hespellia stercorisuis DSM 15480]